MTRGIQQFILVRYRMLITMVWSVVYASLIPTHTHIRRSHTTALRAHGSILCHALRMVILVRLTAVDQGRHNPYTPRSYPLESCYPLLSTGSGRQCCHFEPHRMPSHIPKSELFIQMHMLHVRLAGHTAQRRAARSSCCECDGTRHTARRSSCGAAGHISCHIRAARSSCGAAGHISCVVWPIVIPQPSPRALRELLERRCRRLEPRDIRPRLRCRNDCGPCNLGIGTSALVRI